MDFRGSLEENIRQLEARLEGVRAPPGDRGAMGDLQQLHKEGGSSDVAVPLLQIPPITVPVSCQPLNIHSLECSCKLSFVACVLSLARLTRVPLCTMVYHSLAEGSVLALFTGFHPSVCHLQCNKSF